MSDSESDSGAVIPGVEAGSRWSSLESLNTTIRDRGKQMGYIFKQSLTSAAKCNWYCSNKYGSAAKCPANVRAYVETTTQDWLVIEVNTHNDACTRARQKILGRKIIGPDAYFEPPPSPVPSTPISATTREAATSSTASQRGTSTAQNGHPANAGRGPTGSVARRASARIAIAGHSRRESASSVATSRADKRGRYDSRSPPNALGINGLAAPPWSLFGAAGSVSRRPRSYSQTSSCTTASTSTVQTSYAFEMTRTPTAPPVPGAKITILDPSFHFPGVDLDGVGLDEEQVDEMAQKVILEQELAEKHLRLQEGLNEGGPDDQGGRVNRNPAPGRAANTTAVSSLGMGLRSGKRKRSASNSSQTSSQTAKLATVPGTRGDASRSPAKAKLDPAITLTAQH